MNNKEKLNILKEIEKLKNDLLLNTDMDDQSFVPILDLWCSIGQLADAMGFDIDN